MFGYRVSKGVTSGVIALLQETGVAFTEGVYVAVALAAASAVGGPRRAARAAL